MNIYRYPLLNNVSYQNYENRMKRWRRDAERPRVNTYDDFQLIVEGQEWNRLLVCDFGAISVTKITTEDDHSALLLGDRTLVNGLTDFDHLHIISCTSIQPMLGNTNRVYSFVAEKYGLGFSFAWLLINDADISVQIFNQALTHIDRNFLQDARLSKVTTICDYRMREAVRQIWDGVQISFTFDHYCLAVLHHAHGAINLNDPNQKIILQKLIGLALLPAEKNNEGFNYLWQSMDRETLEVFRTLLLWYYTSLIRGIGVEELSFWGKLKHYHRLETLVVRRLKKRLPSPLAFWRFFDRLVILLRNGHSNLNTLNRGTPTQIRNITTTPKVCQEVKVQVLRRLQFLAEAQTPIPRFLGFIPPVLGQQINTVAHTRQFIAGEFSPISPDEENNHVPPRLELQENADPGNLDNLLMVRNVDDDDQRVINLRGRLNVANHDPAENEGVLLEEVLMGPYQWRCRNCNIRPVSQLCIPCYHVVLCEECSRAVEVQNGPCPECHRQLEEIRRIYIPEVDDHQGDETPYDLRCIICLTATPMCNIGWPCCQLFSCTPCARQIVARYPPGHVACSRCNRGEAVKPVYFRRRV